MVARKGRIMEWKEAFDAAVGKAVGAYEKMEEATGIPESQFIEIVDDAVLKKKEQNK